VWCGHSCPRTLTMSKKHKKSTNRPLKGVRVLVGRARHQAGALSTELRKQGADVLEIPFIEIRKPRSFRPLDSALKNLSTYDWLILTSVNGVEAMWARIENATRRSTTSDLPSKSGRLRVAAIGPATKKAIEQRGVRVDVMPKEYVAESVVRSLKGKVKGKRSLQCTRRERPGRLLSCALQKYFAVPLSSHREQ